MPRDTAHNAAFWIFAASVPLALAGLAATLAFVRGGTAGLAPAAQPAASR